jgi:cytochrome c oxidase assembly protein subunit 11
MFGFGYALVPLYRAICNALGINVLSLAERQVAGNANGSSQHPGRPVAQHHRRVRCQRTRRLGLQAGASSVQVHPGEITTVMYEFRNIQPRVMAAQAIPSYAPKQAIAALQQARVLLLQRIHAAAGRTQAVAGGLRHRPEAAERHQDDHAELHLLRGRRQDSGAAASGRSVEAGAAHMNKESAGLKEAVGRKGSFLQTMRAVGWSFFGVRKSADYEKDVNQLNPVHVVIAAVVGVALFIAALLILVNWVLASGVAK